MHVRAFALPDDLAEAASTLKGERYQDRVVWTDGAATVLRESGGKSVLALVTAGSDVRHPLGDHLAVAVGAIAPVSRVGLARRLYVPDGRTFALDATVLSAEGATGIIEISFHTAEEATEFLPPSWLAGCRELTGPEAWRANGPEGPAGPVALADFRDLLIPGNQQGLALGLMASFPDPHEGMTRWDIVAEEARSLGMTLSRDKADVRTALAPFAGKGEVSRILSEGGREAEILMEDGMFVLSHAPSGTLLGTVQEEGVTVLGPDAALPAILRGVQALALARDGHHHAEDGGTMLLWDAAEAPHVEAILCGIHPVALGSVPAPPPAAPAP